ncbi:MAG: hypothetical protein ACYCWW_12495 [Deltaproteobacteria bacterium]
MRALTLAPLLLWSAHAFAAPVIPSSGGVPEQVTLGAETDSALRIAGGTPLTATLGGPGQLLGKLFLELPRRGKVSGLASAGILLDGKPVKQLVLKRRRQRGTLPAATVVPSVPVGLSLDVPPGSHTLVIRLPVGVNGGAVLDYSATSLSPVALVPAAPRTIEAFAPVVTIPQAVSGGVAAPMPEADQGDRKSVRLAIRAGAVIPTSELSVGGAGGIDVSWILPIGRGTPALDQKLRLSLGVGDSVLHEQGQKIIDGRGLDPNFAEYSFVEPIDLSLVYTLPFGWQSVDIYVGAGYALNLVQSQFQSFGQPSQTGATVSGALFQLGLEIALGPGRLVLEARQSIVGADLGNLGTIGTDTLSGTTLGVGYAYYF